MTKAVVTGRSRLTSVGHILLLVAAVCVAAGTSTAPDWQPIELVLLLLVLAIGSDVLTIDFHGIRVSGSFLAIVLAMALLGPAPAAAIGVVATAVDAVLTPRPWQRTLSNFAVWATFPLVGALLVQAWVVDPTPGGENALTFAGLVFGTFMVTNLLNFVLVAGSLQAAGEGVSLRASFRSVYVTVLPSEVATGLLTAGIAFSYQRLGVGAVGLAAVVLFVFQYLLKAGVDAYDHGEQLQQRTKELASLQVGLINTVMQTLSMRDAMTARHSAAVARYAREVARLLGLSEREQELIHTAGLFHDIGKFIFPDAILLANRKLTEAEWKIVKLHPEQGAKLVRRIEGYGPVADIVISHHERIDGAGYPYGLDGDHIPLGSRILAAADTYDVMTSRDSYRDPVRSEEALAELRRVAGSQLDPLVVDTFIEMIERHGVAFRHADEADFEKELAFERRVDDYARPKAAVA
jgi:putative nucleotidyltransferase with HDIG domain